MFKILISKYNNMSAPVKMAFWFLVCSFIQRGIGMITTPIFTRIMTDSEFGRYSIYSSWYSIISVFVTLGIAGNCLTRGLVVAEGKKERDELASSFYGLIISLVFIYGLVYLVFHKWINSITGLTTYQFFMMGIDFITIQASQVWINTKRVAYKYRGIVFLTLLMAFVRPLIAVILVVRAPVTVQVEARITGVAIANTLVFSSIIVILFIKGKKFFILKNWKYALSFCFPLIPHYLSQTVLNQSDRIMISKFIGDAEAGYYTLAYMLAAIMLMFNSSVAQSLDPWIYRSIKDKKLDRIGPVSYRLTAIIAIINFMVMGLAPELLSILGPENYKSALWAIPPVTASVFFQFMYDLFASFQFYYKKTKWVAIGSCSGAILNIVLNAIFIPIYGFVAAGYTTLVCYVLFGVLHYFFMRKVCNDYLDGYRVYDWRIIFGIGAILIASSFVMLPLYTHSAIRYIVLIVFLGILIINRRTIILLLKEMKERK